MFYIKTWLTQDIGAQNISTDYQLFFILTKVNLKTIHLSKTNNLKRIFIIYRRPVRLLFNLYVYAPIIQLKFIVWIFLYNITT